MASVDHLRAHRLGIGALVVTLTLYLLHRARRSPRARQSAEDHRKQAGAALVRLDDAVAELELEVGLSGALYDGTAPDQLRRTRLTVTHIRDDAFDEYRTIDGDRPPEEVSRVSRKILTRAQDASAKIARARAEHTQWMRANVSAGKQLAAARTRLTEIEHELGDPDALLQALSERVDEAEFRDAKKAARRARAALAEADELLSIAEKLTEDPTRAALPLVAQAERELRAAADATYVFDENARLITEAEELIAEEERRTRDAIRDATELRKSIDSESGDDLSGEIRAAQRDLDALSETGARRPIHTLAAIGHVRDRLDLAIGDARTAQQRLRSARTALIGALTIARSAISHAEPLVRGTDADARSRLSAAQREFADAQTGEDPVSALDAARRAARLAEDAAALATYARRGAR